MMAWKLLSECERLGVALAPAADGQLAVTAPKGTVTPELLASLKAHKPALLRLLRLNAAWRTAIERFHAPGYVRAGLRAARLEFLPPTAPKPQAVCPCGSTAFRDVPIHGGRSVRRDCARCGRFLGFPTWYGHN